MAIIGIDLGTTNSLATVWRDGKSVLIPNSLGEFVTPSVVSVNENGGIITGNTAKQRLVSHPDRTASLFKQYMGSSKSYIIGGLTFNPEDLSAIILRSLKSDAEAFLGEEIAEAIISVPAYFNDTQRSATKAAGQLAGLKVDRILNEPSAAALAYRQHDVCDGTNLVFDFGGGTLDISVLEAFGNIVDILAVSGDNQLGGSDIDAAIMTAFLHEHPGLVSGLSQQQRGILLKTAEASKIALTDRQHVFMSFRHQDNEFVMALDNERLMQICSPMLIRFKEVIKRAMQNAERPLSMIDNIILIGGSCRMPLVQEYLRHLTQKPVLSDIDPDMAVAIGVGVAAGIKERNEDIRDMVLTDICPFSLGVGIINDVFSPIIPRNTALPASRVKTYYTVSDYQENISLSIYQGESLEASKNLLLGEGSITVPKLPKGQASVDVRFSYDINGILDVEFQSNQGGEVVRELIVGNSRLSQEEINKRVLELSKLKTAPRDDELNNLLIARGQRLYEEFSGHMGERIASYLSGFVHELERGVNPARSAKMRADLSSFFDHLDAYSENLLFFGKAELDDDVLGEND